MPGLTALSRPDPAVHMFPATVQRRLGPTRLTGPRLSPCSPEAQAPAVDAPFTAWKPRSPPSTFSSTRTGPFGRQCKASAASRPLALWGSSKSGSPGSRRSMASVAGRMAGGQRSSPGLPPEGWRQPYLSVPPGIPQHGLQRDLCTGGLTGGRWESGVLGWPHRGLGSGQGWGRCNPGAHQLLVPASARFLGGPWSGQRGEAQQCRGHLRPLGAAGTDGQS